MIDPLESYENAKNDLGDKTKILNAISFKHLHCQSVTGPAIDLIKTSVRSLYQKGVIGLVVQKDSRVRVVAVEIFAR